MSATKYVHATLVLAAALMQACATGNGPEPDVAIIGASDGGVAPSDGGLDASKAACTDPGCDCVETAAAQSCYPEPIYASDGQKICAQGSSYCRNGVWSQCESLVQYQLTPSSNGLSRISSALIADAATCNVCHPDCFDAVDAPVASDLNSSNSSNIDYDPDAGGIRLHIIVNASQRGSINATAVCGNGVLENGINGGVEQCDDGNTRALDGCDALCRLETTQNWICPTAGQACRVATCGNGSKEGSEGCDDGNDVVGDGCGPDCKVEPSCAVGAACVSSCGDGIKLPADVNEQCDDGNTIAGDGCSATCKIESGYGCTQVGGTLPSSFPLTVTYRDFIRAAANGSSQHPDFETFSGSAATLGMVGNTLVSGKPTYTGICEKNRSNFPASPTCGGGTQPQSTSSARFAQWYANTEIAGVMKKFVTTVTMNQQGTTSSYRNATFGQQLLPLNNMGWVATSPQYEVPFVLNGANTNFSFTTEIHYWFKFQGGEVLTFSGDDDVWVFIAGNLALDLGGLHSKLDRTISINNSGHVNCFVGTTASGTSCGSTNLPLTTGNVYEMALFHAERHTNASNFDLTLSGFIATKSVCTSVCGDGIVTTNEFCDDGVLNGGAGYCLTDCSGRAAKYATNAKYWRDYTALGSCTVPPERPIWGSLTWLGDTTTGGGITFQLQGADAASDLAAATVVSVNAASSATGGNFDIPSKLLAAGVRDDPLYLRVTAVLNASADQKTTPVLRQFDVSLTCHNAE